LRLLAAFLIFLLAIGRLGAQNSGAPPSIPQDKSRILKADLRRCYELAAQQSEVLGISEAEIRAAQARYWQAVSAILPSLSALATEEVQNSSSRSSSFSSNGFNVGGINGQSSFEGRLSVTQTIFNGFRDFKRASARKYDTAARQSDYIRSCQLLYLDVSDVFYQILSEEADLAVLAKVRTSLEERIEELERRVHLGRSRKGDLLQAQTELAETKVTIEQVKGLLGASRELMAFLINTPASGFALRETQPFPQADGLAKYLSLTGERPDVYASEQRKNAAEQDLAAVRSERWPTIGFQGNYVFAQDPDQGDEWNFLVSAELPIFDGGLRESRVSENKALVHISQLDLNRLRRQAASDVRVAYNNFISAAAQFARLNDATEVSRKNYETQKSDYDLGRTSNLDVLAALTTLQDLKRREVGAEMQARASYVQLHVAAGQIGPAN